MSITDAINHFILRWTSSCARCGVHKKYASLDTPRPPCLKMISCIRIIVTILTVAILLLFLPVGRTFAQAPDNSCIKCHSELDGKYNKLVIEWNNSVHKSAQVYCEDCHGGDSKSLDDAIAMSKSNGFIGTPRPKEIPGLCAKCHANVLRMRQYNIRTDQYSEYVSSVHGRLLFQKGDEKIATCASCHGSHDIRKKDDPLSSVYHTKVPETCGRCHSNQEYMKGYGIPVDQLKKYKEGYHGQILYEKIPGKNPSLVPSCADCHGIHGATPPGVKEVVNVCGNCHGNTSDRYKESPHYDAMQASGVPRCVDCHGNHDNKFPTVEMFVGTEERHCGSCHDASSSAYNTAERIYDEIGSLEKLTSKLNDDIETIEKASGKNIEDLVLTLEEAQNKLIEVGPVTHALDLERILGYTNDAKSKALVVKDGVEKIRSELKGRKKVFLVSVLLILFIVIILYLKLRLADNENT